ncbi:type ISP restriction/modification enzyme [Zobellia galactanivorans]|uniref:Type ISP restriction-modification enzyme LLaBIII C-terminal specificity domain-containing protein n=1 Tax=Zobellia galactanivorans (strain DSM 12802 / CCUG 47099 / CIP 106680 / NCIMB 13871 / Dsij) TaxID=63186 RepID=G0L0F8_ZOBGA|nr:type ISP restriction/modification enzyme [Zobellia galactanivorans]CAZ94382.1 Hypothetical protein ZOBELLIA_309 [Zobellia galactanivorans]
MSYKADGKASKNMGEASEATTDFCVSGAMLMTYVKNIETLLKPLTTENPEKAPPPFDLGPKIVPNMERALGLSFVPEKDEHGNMCMANNPEVRNEYKDTFDHKDLMGYIYAIWHSPTYQKAHNTALKNDSFRIPYPKDPNFFWQLAGLGLALRAYHKLQAPLIEKHKEDIAHILKQIALATTKASP